MSAPPDRILVARQWIEKADNDLVAAAHTLKLAEDCPFEIVCYHARQCAEKYLKALLISRSIEFPKTHDLRLLIQLVPQNDRLGLDLNSLLSLNRYATDARYPGYFEPITREEAEDALDTARKVKNAVKSNLPEGTVEK